MAFHIQPTGADEWQIVTLSNIIARTPAGNILILRGKKLALSVATSLAMFEDEKKARHNKNNKIAPPPLLQSVFTIIDKGNSALYITQLQNYIATDLLFFHLSHPAELREKQKALFQPWLDWISEQTNAEWKTTSLIGSGFNQSPEALEGFKTLLRGLDIWRLFILCELSEIFHSPILALATLLQAITPDEAFTLSLFEEDSQISRWGEDEDITQRRALTKSRFDEIMVFLKLYREKD